MNGGLAAGGLVPLLVVGAVALLASAAAVWLVVELGRRRRALEREARDLVRAIEDVRSGHTPSAAAENGSVLELAFDAVARLAGDWTERAAELERELERAREATNLDAPAAEAIVVTDADGDIRQIGAGVSALLERDASELVGRPLGELFQDDAFRDVLPRLSRRELGRDGLTMRTRLRGREGRPVVADVTVRRLESDGGRTAGYRLSIADAGPLEALEARAEEAEQRYRGLIAGLADGVAVVRDGVVVEANARLAELAGRSVADAVGTRLRDLVATRDVLALDAALAELAAGTAEGHGAWRCRLGEAEREVGIEARAIRLGGEPGVLLVVRDETVERRVDAELRRNEAQLDAVLEASPDGVVVLAERGGGAIVQMTNRAFLDRFGLAARTLLGARQARLAALLRERGEGAQAIAALLDADEPRRTTVTLLGPRPGELDVRVAPLLDRAGRRLGRIVVVQDDTERRESERRLQRQADEVQLGKAMLEKAYAKLERDNSELERRIDALQRFNQELRTLDEMKTNLLGNVSHELQTPLVAIRGYTEMILKGRLGSITEEQRKGLELSLKNIDRLISMIDNLLVFSTAKDDAESLSLTEFALAPLVDECAALLEEKLTARDVSFEARVDPALRLYADREKVQQILINLLSNAIKFNREHGAVTVTATRGDGRHAAVSVDDTGVGIPADELDRIFERTYQVRSAGGPSAGGAGIGLSIVRDLLRLHGCRISVSSQVGRGTRFDFGLPLAEGDEATDAGPEAAHDDAAPSTAERPDRPDTAATARPRFRIIRPRGNGTPPDPDA